MNTRKIHFYLSILLDSEWSEKRMALHTTVIFIYFFFSFCVHFLEVFFGGFEEQLTTYTNIKLKLTMGVKSVKSSI